MLIKVKVWRGLSPKEKFDLLLEHANLQVIGSQVVKAQKNKSYKPNRMV